MPELVSITVIRDRQSLSPKEIDNTGIKTHQENLVSERYQHWQNLCESKEHNTLFTEMRNFIESDEPIKTYNQITSDLSSIIKYAEYYGYRKFDNKEFAKQVDLRKLANELGKEIKNEGCYNTQSPFFDLITNFNDQLLVMTQLDIPIKHEFDLQGAIKTLKLVETLYLSGRENFQINIDKHFAKPLIINSCILDIDPCSLLPKTIDESNKKVVYDNADGAPPNDTGKKCRCKEDKNTDCECKCNDECLEQNPCCAEITPYIAELFVVKDDICKYEPSEISYIENVMKSEIRVRKHRHLQREENYTENEEETNTYEEKNLQIDKQYSLHNEIDKIVDQSLSVDAGATYSNNSSFGGTSKGGLTLSANKSFNASLNTSYNWSKKEARKQVQDESKHIISNAISRVEKNIRTLSTQKLINEIEEKNKHTFGGTTGALKDMSRQFYYVNQIRKAQVFSYGKRAMLDFYLPEPSELLKRLIEKQFDLKKPKKPCINIEDIGTSTKDWLEFIQCYGFTELEKPPTLKPDIIKTFPITKEGKGEKWTAEENIIIPDGYKAIEMQVDSRNKPASGSNRYVKFNFGNKTLTDYNGNGQDDKGPKSINVTQSGKVFIEVHKLNSFIASLTMKFSQHPAIDYLPWQLEVHKLLMKKYEDELTEYNEAFSEFQKQKENHFNKNPFILSELMKEQLKHAAISYITCQFFDDNNAMKQKVKGCGFPQMDIPETKREGEFVRFIEQAFEWKFMNYMLYSYFWGRKCTWEDKFKEESESYLFTKFLRAGYVRISISVKPGFEEMVGFYLKTKRIWNGVEPPIMGDAFVPIIQEIKEDKDNFNADRTGYLTWDKKFDKNEIKLCDNLDYYIEDTSAIGTYKFDKDKTDVDINREITINCVTYRIIDIEEHDPISRCVKITLDRELEIDCCCSGKEKDFEKIYLDKQLPWSTGALFIGAPWKFSVPTSLTWLREEEGCLPCYPIECK